MKTKTLFGIILSVGAATASADVISETNPASLDWGLSGSGNPLTVGPTTLYSSDISVAGATGAITDVNITLNGGQIDDTEDLNIVLVSPTGTVVGIMTGAGGADPVTGDLTFDDAAAGLIPDNNFPVGNGTFRPSVHGGVSGVVTNPDADGDMLSLFNGEDANGIWSLYVYDAFSGGTGAFSGGWTLDIVTVPAPASAALLAAGGLLSSRRRR